MELKDELLRATLAGDDGRRLSVVTTERGDGTFLTQIFDDSNEGTYEGRLVGGMRIEHDTSVSYTDPQARATHLRVIGIATLEPITAAAGDPA